MIYDANGKAYRREIGFLGRLVAENSPRQEIDLISTERVEIDELVGEALANGQKA